MIVRLTELVVPSSKISQTIAFDDVALIFQNTLPTRRALATRYSLLVGGRVSLNHWIQVNAFLGWKSTAASSSELSSVLSISRKLDEFPSYNSARRPVAGPLSRTFTKSPALYPSVIQLPPSFRTIRGVLVSNTSGTDWPVTSA